MLRNAAYVVLVALALDLLIPLRPLTPIEYFPGNIANGFLMSQTVELNETEVIIEGHLPDWLSGSLLRLGPALYEVGNDSVNTIFDGHAMLYKLRFVPSGDKGEPTRAYFSSRFLNTYNLRRDQSAGYLVTPSAGVMPRLSLLERLWTFICGLWNAPGNPTYSDFENTNVQIGTIPSAGFSAKTRPFEVIAMTEVPNQMMLDPSDLSTIGRVRFVDEGGSLGGGLTTAHPAVTRKGTLLNILSDPFERKYTIAESIAARSDGIVRRRVVATLRTERVAYQHHFSATQKYAVLAENPYFFDPVSIFLDELRQVFMGTSGGFFSYLSWEPDKGFWFRLVRLSDGVDMGRFRAPRSFFTYHHINAFDRTVSLPDGTDRDEVVIDLCTIPNPEYDTASIQSARQHMTSLLLHKEGPTSRFVIDVNANSTARKTPGGAVTELPLLSEPFELPRMNDAKLQSEYKYIYGLAETDQEYDAQRPDPYGPVRIFAGLGKINITEALESNGSRSSLTTWTLRDGQHTTRSKFLIAVEPIFAPKPTPKGSKEKQDEDDGVLMSYIFDAVEQRTFGVVLDAKNMNEIARFYLPNGYHIPMNFHGLWLEWLQ